MLARPPLESVRSHLLPLTQRMRRQRQRLLVFAIIGQPIEKAVSSFVEDLSPGSAVAGIPIDYRCGARRGHLRCAVQIASMVEGLAAVGPIVSDYGLKSLVDWCGLLGTAVRRV